jgi:hypothetical protein
MSHRLQARRFRCGGAWANEQLPSNVMNGAVAFLQAKIAAVAIFSDDGRPIGEAIDPPCLLAFALLLSQTNGNDGTGNCPLPDNPAQCILVLSA